MMMYGVCVCAMQYVYRVYGTFLDATVAAIWGMLAAIGGASGGEVKVASFKTEILLMNLIGLVTVHLDLWCT